MQSSRNTINTSVFLHLPRRWYYIIKFLHRTKERLLVYSQLADCSENDKETSSSTHTGELLSLLWDYPIPYKWFYRAYWLSNSIFNFVNLNNTRHTRRNFKTCKSSLGTDEKGQRKGQKLFIWEPSSLLQEQVNDETHANTINASEIWRRILIRKMQWN